ncbi:MAG: hypothetical protein NTX43_14285 [Bacteroidetes bacterium]|nr:hypothetical protein [Bacteroidota bacterium]
MKKYYKYFACAVALLYFFLGFYVLSSKQLAYLPQTIKVTFSLFLFLYGAFRLARIWSKSREESDE